MNPTNFQCALVFALQWEGGYSNHPADKGGATNRGIITSVYNAYRDSKSLPRRDVRFLQEHELQEIYFERYWKPSHCDLLSRKLAIAHFDWAVNAGVGRAIKTLQQIIGTPADGIWGPLTEHALSEAIGTTGETILVRKYMSVREACYRRWGVGSQRVFLKGWLNRASSLRGYLA